MRGLRQRPPRPGRVEVVVPFGTVKFPPTSTPATDSNCTVQSVWIGKSLSTMEQLCIRSFLKNGHKFVLYTYNDMSGIPDGTTVLDANSLVPEADIKSFRYIANFSDFFRYTMLLNGGWYVDMDSVCLRALEFKSEYVFAAAACDNYYSPVINPLYSADCYIENGYIKVPAGNKVMGYCRDLIVNWKSGSNQDYCEPMRFIQRGVKKFDLQRYVQPPAVFDPLSFYKLGDVVNPYVSWDLSRAYVVHLIRSGWAGGSHVHSGLDINGAYPSECLYEVLKRRYL